VRDWEGREEVGTGKEMQGVGSAANIELYKTHSIENTSYAKQVAEGALLTFRSEDRCFHTPSPFALGVFVCVRGVVDEGVWVSADGVCVCVCLCVCVCVCVCVCEHLVSPAHFPLFYFWNPNPPPLGVFRVFIISL
jgi:hypothetical protein